MPPESSTESEAGADTSAEANQDVNSENSSNSEAGVETPSLLESVEAALSPGEEGSPTSETGKEKAEQAQGGKDKSEEDQELPELTEDEIKSHTPNAQRRIRQLVSERDDWQGQVDRLKPRAEQWDRVASYMRQHDIQPSHVDNALEITRRINAGQWSEAMEVLAPIYREVAARAGAILPDDLAEEVRLGHITEQRARELAKAQAASKAAGERETRMTEKQREEAESAKHQQIIDTAVGAVDKWAKSKAGSDPDWHLKHEDVQEEVDHILRKRMEKGVEGFPQTADDAVAIAEQALKNVEDRIKRYRPPPKEHRTPTGQFASPHAKVQPKSLMEAVDAALYSDG